MERSTITAEYVRSLIRPRDPEMHKGNCGRVLICAGGAGMTGAAIFASRAALRSGSGLVYLCTPESNFPVLQTAVPEAICLDRRSAEEHLFPEDAGWTFDAVAFGPGMGTSEETRDLLRAILTRCDKPLVIDADGLNCLAAEKALGELAAQYPGELVITPHIGEARRLLTAKDLAPGTERDAMVSALVRGYRCIAVLKGAGTLVAREAPELELWKNTTGNPGMATAGSGDVLTGLIAGLAGQGLPLWDAAKAGVWLHGRAGDIAADKIGEYGLIASDIAEAIAPAMKEAAG